MSELILSLRSSSPSPSVIFPLRSRIVTPSTTRSSICIAVPLLSALFSPTFRRQKRPASVLRDSRKCQIFSRLGLGLARRRRRPGYPLPQRFDHHIQYWYEDDVQKGGQEHAPCHRGPDRVPCLLPRAGGEDERQHAQDEGQRGHQNRPQADPPRLDQIGRAHV